MKFSNCCAVASIVQNVFMCLAVDSSKMTVLSENFPLFTSETQSTDASGD